MIVCSASKHLLRTYKINPATGKILETDTRGKNSYLSLLQETDKSSNTDETMRTCLQGLWDYNVYT